MTMEDWAKWRDKFLECGDWDSLAGHGNIPAAIAKDHAGNEFEKYRLVQDRLFESDLGKT